MKLNTVTGANIAALLARGPWVFGELDDRKVIKTDVGGITHETKGGGTCDACGQAIQVVVRFRKPDAPLSQASRNAGLVLHLGQDCAAHLAKALGSAHLQLQLKKASAQHDKDVVQARIKAARSALPAVLDKLAQAPHSQPHLAARGLTRADEARYLLESRTVGLSGRLRAVRMVEAAGGNDAPVSR